MGVSSVSMKYNELLNTTVCRICIIRDGMMILGGCAGSPKISTVRSARSVVALLL